MGSFVGVITKWTCKSNFEFEKKLYIYIISSWKCFLKMYLALCCCVLRMMVKSWKKSIDYVNVGSIWIKILHAIVCNLNWIDF
jgi:hypothetical protein